MKRLLCTAVASLAVAGVAGCGADTKYGTSGPSNASPIPVGVTGGTVTPPGARPSVVVTMQNISFSPRTIHVKVGQTIRWVNRDNVIHNVTSDHGTLFASANFGRGGSFQYTPQTAGTVRYVCTLHASAMTGSIVVAR